VLVRKPAPPEISGVLCADDWIAASSAPARKTTFLRQQPCTFVEMFRRFHIAIP
jgi:hypothetical protein